MSWHRPSPEELKALEQKTAKSSFDSLVTQSALSTVLEEHARRVKQQLAESVQQFQEGAKQQEQERQEALERRLAEQEQWLEEAFHDLTFQSATAALDAQVLERVRGMERHVEAHLSRSQTESEEGRTRQRTDLDKLEQRISKRLERETSLRQQALESFDRKLHHEIDQKMSARQKDTKDLRERLEALREHVGELHTDRTSAARLKDLEASTDALTRQVDQLTQGLADAKAQATSGAASREKLAASVQEQLDDCSSQTSLLNKALKELKARVAVVQRPDDGDRLGQLERRLNGLKETAESSQEQLRARGAKQARLEQAVEALQRQLKGLQRGDRWQELEQQLESLRDASASWSADASKDIDALASSLSGRVEQLATDLGEVREQMAGQCNHQPESEQLCAELSQRQSHLEARVEELAKRLGADEALRSAAEASRRVAELEAEVQKLGATLLSEKAHREASEASQLEALEALRRDVAKAQLEPLRWKPSGTSGGSVSASNGAAGPSSASAAEAPFASLQGKAATQAEVPEEAHPEDMDLGALSERLAYVETELAQEAAVREAVTTELREGLGSQALALRTFQQATKSLVAGEAAEREELGSLLRQQLSAHKEAFKAQMQIQSERQETVTERIESLAEKLSRETAERKLELAQLRAASSATGTPRPSPRVPPSQIAQPRPSLVLGKNTTERQ